MFSQIASEKNPFSPCRIFHLLLLWIIINTPRITTENVIAIFADSFVESIHGVNTRWLNTEVYTENYTELKAELTESDILYLRDEANVTMVLEFEQIS